MNFRQFIHRLFQLSLILKALDGVLQILGAIFLGVVKPELLTNWIRFLTTHELSQDPKDYIANQIAGFANSYDLHTQWFAIIYLFSHGIIKMFLVYNLLKRKLWAYPAAILVFGLFALYQIYRYEDTHSLGLALLTVLDVIVIVLTWFEYRRLKRLVA